MNTAPHPPRGKPQAQGQRQPQGKGRNQKLANLPDRQFYLHIGVHKTGTTALQKFLHDNQKQLDKQGVHRLQTGVPADNKHSWGNHELAWTLRDQDEKGLWQDAAEEAAPYQAVLASSEDLSSIKIAKRYIPIRRAMSNFAIRPICYLRRQDQLLESTYNFHVKSLGETGTIMEFSERIMKRLEFDKVLGCLGNTFGDETVILRIYAPDHLKGDIFEDFADAIGITETDKLEKPEKTLNPGLTREGLDRMLEANRELQDAPEKLADRRQKILSDYAAPTWSEHELLSPDERRTIQRHFRPGNTHVARRFLGRNALF